MVEFAWKLSLDDQWLMIDEAHIDLSEFCWLNGSFVSENGRNPHSHQVFDLWLRVVYMQIFMVFLVNNLGYILFDMFMDLLWENWEDLMGKIFGKFLLENLQNGLKLWEHF